MLESGETDVYTHGHHASVLRSHSWRTVENSAKYLRPHLQPNLNVLDVGCGPGTITCDMATMVAPGTVTAIDTTDQILATAEATRIEWGADNVSFELASVYELPYGDDTFDVSHAHQVLQHLSNPVLALSEMRRVTKPGGVVAVRDADYQGMSWAPADPALTRWMEIYQEVARRNDAEPNAARHLLSWAREAGYEIIEPSAEAWVFATEDTREWWGSLWAERIVSSSLAAQAVEYGAATADEMQEIAEAFRNWASSPDGWFLVPNGELILRV